MRTRSDFARRRPIKTCTVADPKATRSPRISDVQEDPAEEDFDPHVHKGVELDSEAHPVFAGLPVSAVQFDNRGDVVRVAKRANDARQSD